MVKTKILTKQAIALNIIDALKALDATSSTLKCFQEKEEAINLQIWCRCRVGVCYTSQEPSGSTKNR